MSHKELDKIIVRGKARDGEILRGQEIYVTASDGCSVPLRVKSLRFEAKRRSVLVTLDIPGLDEVAMNVDEIYMEMSPRSLIIENAWGFTRQAYAWPPEVVSIRQRPDGVVERVEWALSRCDGPCYVETAVVNVTEELRKAEREVDESRWSIIGVD